MSGTQSELSIVETTVTTLGARIATYGLGFVASVLISRALGPTGRGLYYLPVALATMAFTVGSLGIEMANVHLLSSRRYALSRLVANALRLALGLGALAMVAGGGAFLILRGSAFHGVPTANAAIMLATVPLSIASLYCSGLLVLGRRIGDVNRITLAASGVQLAVVLVAYVVGHVDVVTVLIANAGSVLVGALLLVATTVRRLGVDWSVPRPVARDSLAYGARVHLGAILAFFSLRLDVFLLNALSNANAVGVYSLSVMLAELLLLLTTPLALAAMPRQVDSDHASAADLSFRVARASWLFGLCASVALVLVAWLVVPLLYGRAFAASLVPLAVLAPGVVAMGAQRPLAQFALRLDRPGRMSLIAGVTVAVNLALNLLLIPGLGPTGAAAASLLSYSLSLVLFGVWISRACGLPLSSLWSFTGEDLAGYARLGHPIRVLRQAIKRIWGSDSP